VLPAVQINAHLARLMRRFCAIHYVMRHEVNALLALGPFPSSSDASVQHLEALENALTRMPKSVTDDEACALVKLFGPDECFGLAWTLLHLIETAPGWALQEALHDTSNEWVARLRERALLGDAPHAA
jgi:hypothetical protein